MIFVAFGEPSLDGTTHPLEEFANTPTLIWLVSIMISPISGSTGPAT